MKFARKLSLISLALVSIPLLVIVLVTVSLLESQVRQQKAKDVDTLANIFSFQVPRKLATASEKVSLITSNEALQTHVSVFDQGGDKEEIRNIISEANDINQEIQDISIYTLNGELIHSTDSAVLAGATLDYIPPSATKPVFTSYEVENGQTELYFVGPILKNGEAIGYIRASFPLGTLISKNTTDIQQYELILKGTTENGQNYVFFNTRDDYTARLLPLIEYVSSTNEFPAEFSSVNVGEEEYHITSRQVQFGEQKITTVIDVNLADVDALVVNGRNLLLTLFVITLLVMVVVIEIVGRQIARPIHKLASATKRIEQNDFSVRVDTKGTDELSQLAELFNSMSEKLGNKYQNLEGAVKESTDALKAKISDLEKLNDLMVNREMKMIELKDKLEQDNNSKNKKDVPK